MRKKHDMDYEKDSPNQIWKKPWQTSLGFFFHNGLFLDIRNEMGEIYKNVSDNNIACVYYDWIDDNTTLFTHLMRIYLYTLNSSDRHIHSYSQWFLKLD